MTLPDTDGLKLRLLAGAALALALALLAGWLWPPYSSHGLYGDIDGQWARLNAIGALAWGDPLDFSPYNPLAGLGTVFPPNSPWINPGALALLLPDPDLAGFLSYLWYVLVLSASLWLLAAVLGLPAQVGLLACLLHVGMLFPPFDGLFQAANWYSAAPFYAQLSAALNLALACLVMAGRARPLRAIPWGIGFLACASLAFLTAPFTALVFAPFHAVIALACLFERPPAGSPAPAWQPAAIRLACALAALALFLLSGAAEHVLATASASARLPQPPEIGPQGWLGEAWQALATTYGGGDLCWRPGESLCPNRGYAWLQLLGLGGALLWIWQGRRRAQEAGAQPAGMRPGAGLRRSIGIAFALYYLAFLLYTPLYARDLVGVFSVMSSGFMIWSAYGIAAIQAAALLDRLATAPLRRLAAAMAGLAPLRGRVLQLAGGAVLAAALLLAAHAVLRPLAQPGSGRPVVDRGASNPLVEVLAGAVALQPGASFAGRVASLLGGAAYVDPDPPATADPRPPVGRQRLAAGRQSPWQEPLGWIAALQAHRRATGNRFWGSDLWERGIPTLGEYGQWSTPLAHAVFDTLLHDPWTEQGPNYLTASRFRPELLRLFGVSVLVSDLPLQAPGLEPLAELPSADGTVLRAWRLSDPNLGQYSPRRAVPVAGLEELRQRMLDPATDLRQTVFVLAGGAPPERDWQPARGGRLQMLRDGFRVTADAAGPALLLLSVQYSDCLRIDAAHSPAPPFWLGRGDGLLTLLAFEERLDAVLDFGFGLGRDAACRRGDGAEMQAWRAPRPDGGQRAEGEAPGGAAAGGIPSGPADGYLPPGGRDRGEAR